MTSKLNGVPEELIDPILNMVVTVNAVQPYQANKEYLCPGCGHTIPVGVGHIVSVPIDAAELRRHWHKPCWEHRNNRRPGR